MPPGGWKDIEESCPREGCDGWLRIKALGGKHLATKCSHCDYEKRERIKP